MNGVLLDETHYFVMTAKKASLLNKVTKNNRGPNNPEFIRN